MLMLACPTHCFLVHSCFLLVVVQRLTTVSLPANHLGFAKRLFIYIAPAWPLGLSAACVIGRHACIGLRHHSTSFSNKDCFIFVGSLRRHCGKRAPRTSLQARERRLTLSGLSGRTVVRSYAAQYRGPTSRSHSTHPLLPVDK
jgi:hypothetical protein